MPLKMLLLRLVKKSNNPLLPCEICTKIKKDYNSNYLV